MHYFFSAVLDVFVLASELIRPHLSQVAMAVAATLLAIFGSDINRSVKRLVKQWPLVVRVLVFVVLVAFGYGAAGLLVSHLLMQILMQVDNRYLALLVVAAFFLIAVLAEHKGHV
jgi:hypothetical protein